MKEMNAVEFVDAVIATSFSKVALDMYIRDFKLESSYLYEIKDIVRNAMVLRWYTAVRFLGHKVAPSRFITEENGKMIGVALSKSIMQYDYSSYNDSELKSEILVRYQIQSKKYDSILIQEPQLGFLNWGEIGKTFAHITGGPSDRMLITFGEKICSSGYIDLKNNLGDISLTF